MQNDYDPNTTKKFIWFFIGLVIFIIGVITTLMFTGRGGFA